MKKKYRIKKRVYSHENWPHVVQVVYTVQVRNILRIWTDVKSFHDRTDEEFAKREAVELFETLNDN